jgi:hypothetical protein
VLASICLALLKRRRVLAELRQQHVFRGRSHSQRHRESSAPRG